MLTLLFFSLPLQFIVVFVVKVLKMKEVNDVREYEEEDDGRAAAAAVGLHADPKTVKDNGDGDAGHHSGQG